MCAGIDWPTSRLASSFEKLLQLLWSRLYACSGPVMSLGMQVARGDYSSCMRCKCRGCSVVTACSRSGPILLPGTKGTVRHSMQASL